MIMTSPPVRIRGHLTGWTGYGQIAEWLGRALEARKHAVGYEDYGADLRWLPQQDFVRDRITAAADPWAVIHLASPDHPFDRGAPTLFFTMWESTDLSAQAVALLNAADAVAIPSAWNRDHFLRNGVTTPIFLCPLGVNPGEGYVPTSISPGGPTVFGMAGRLTGGGGQRKNLNAGVRAFLDAFPPGVRGVELRVKIWPDDFCYLDPPRDPRVTVDTTPMLPSQMAAWTRDLTCLFVPSHAEGWGLHTHQALACGRPVIACRYGGTAEYFDGSCGWELGFDLVPAAGYYKDRGLWAAPRHESMVECLREAHSDRLACRRRGAAGAARAAEFPWSRTAAAVEIALETAVARFGARATLCGGTV